VATKLTTTRPADTKNRRAHKIRAWVRAKAHTAVLENPYWFGDGPPAMPEKFNAKNTKARQPIVISVLNKAAARSPSHLNSAAYTALIEKLEWCPPQACGSLADPVCGRAFQRAKAAAQTDLISQINRSQVDKKLVLVTIVPLNCQLQCGTLHRLNIHKFNKELFKAASIPEFEAPWFGSVDVSLERSANGQKYWQPHWHLCMWTNDSEALRKQLKALFPPAEKYDYPVDVFEPHNLNFLPYINKGMKLVELLRAGRTHLPELLLVLDQIRPLDLMITHGVVISDRSGGFKLIVESQRKYGNDQ
jgi:hypothetical protein